MNTQFHHILEGLIQLPLTIPDYIHNISQHVLGEGQLNYKIHKKYRVTPTIPKPEDLKRALPSKAAKSA